MIWSNFILRIVWFVDDFFLPFICSFDPAPVKQIDFTKSQSFQIKIV